jgi:hypothetical protein
VYLVRAGEVRSWFEGTAAAIAQFAKRYRYAVDGLLAILNAHNGLLNSTSINGTSDFESAISARHNASPSIVALHNQPPIDNLIVTPSNSWLAMTRLGLFSGLPLLIFVNSTLSAVWLLARAQYYPRGQSAHSVHQCGFQSADRSHRLPRRWF